MGINLAFYARIAEKTASKQVKRFRSRLHAYNAADDDGAGVDSSKD